MKYYFKALQNYATFKGRASRSEFWYFVLFHFIFAVIIGIASAIMETTLLYNIYTLAVFTPAIAANFRRMHDVGRSGWYSLIPIYGLILACTKGIEGDNEYGVDPLANPERLNN